LWYLRDALPSYAFLFLWDNAHAPYGNKSPQQIESLTFSWLEWLFGQWCSLVIIACNTAAAYAVRKRQFLYPQKKVLSVTIPGVESMIASSCRHFTVYATEATVLSDIYSSLYYRLGGVWVVDSVAVQDWVGFVEQWHLNHTLISPVLAHQFSSLNQSCDCLVLWCTHFSALVPFFRSFWHGQLIDSGSVSAFALVSYLSRHQEIDSVLSRNAQCYYYVTGDVLSFSQRASDLFDCTFFVQAASYSL